MKVYISIASFGSYEDKEQVIIYAGINYELAFEKCKEYKFPDDCNNYAWVETWENGVEITHEYVIE